MGGSWGERVWYLRMPSVAVLTFTGRVIPHDQAQLSRVKHIALLCVVSMSKLIFAVSPVKSPVEKSIRLSVWAILN